ncbi:D-alanine--D-alanine ligase [Pseudomonas sp. S31]|uniref:D-alanine--D-alanine ligase family protein n=1 Tax=Pseudomonas sp. S31 TaxID=1564473 RepID=UPI0019137757|nr:D-alanine--D-alanine ligase [Pseudomonas sp. S31]MBK5000707.1 D-alanine--D-alanine ligase [Pseudomonas sp. S31]
MINYIAIITGGDSSERDVSLQTAAAVSNSLMNSNIQHEVFTISEFKDLHQLDLTRFTRVFLALHGGFGENGMAQGYLEALGIPYNGPSPQASAICMDKLLTKHIAQGLGISVADYMYFKTQCTADFGTVRRRLGDTFIVKPNREGCSFGVSLIRNSDSEFAAAVHRAEAFNTGILIESFIPGPELSVCYYYGCLLPVYMIEFESDFFSYNAKFVSPKTTATLATLDHDCYDKLKADCFAIAEALQLDYFRADFILKNSSPYLIELNTLPGLTSHSLFPKACLEHGVSFDDLILRLNNLQPSATSSSSTA